MINLGPLAYSVRAVRGGGSKILLHILYFEETCMFCKNIAHFAVAMEALLKFY